MSEEQYAQFFELLDILVGETDKNASEKRGALLAEADEADKTNLEEFNSWFATT